MNKPKQTIEESLKKIKFMMNYDSSQTLTEQSDTATSRWDPNQKRWVSTVPSEVSENFINGIVDSLYKYYSKAEAIVNGMSAYTNNGKPGLEAVKEAYRIKYGKELPGSVMPTEDITKPDPIKGPVDTPTQTKQWPFAKGTEDSPFKYGTQGSGIAQVQQALGLTQDGKWGPVTDGKIKELAPEFANGFTNDSIMQVIQKVRGQVNPTAITPPNLKQTTNLAPAQNTAQLAGNTIKPRA
jgi:hypothetical protein